MSDLCQVMQLFQLLAYLEAVVELFKALQFVTGF